MTHPPEQDESHRAPQGNPRRFQVFVERLEGLSIRRVGPFSSGIYKRPEYFRPLGAKLTDPLPLAIAVALAELAFGRTLVTPTAERCLRFLFEDCLDEAGCALAYFVLERVMRPADR